MERIIVDFLERHFTDREQESIRQFFKTKKFNEEGQVYLVSLLAHAKVWENFVITFLFIHFNWKTTWRYIPICSRANLTIDPKKNNIARKERRNYLEICRAAGIPSLNLEKLQRLWGEDFSRLPKSVKDIDFNVKPKKKVKNNIEFSTERLLTDVFGKKIGE